MDKERGGGSRGLALVMSGGTVRMIPQKRLVQGCAIRLRDTIRRSDAVACVQNANATTIIIP